jgi:hypothetical protein
MSERQFTEEEKRAAWEKADTVDSPDPGKFRRDVKGLLIERDKYQDKEDRDGSLTSKDKLVIIATNNVSLGMA